MDKDNLHQIGYRALHVSLGKMLAAAAWVDGELNDSELECLKTTILNFPDVSFEDWRKLKIYLAYPIGKSEQLIIVEDFIDKVFVAGHSKKAWDCLAAILKADGRLNEDEKKFALILDQEIKESSEGFLRKIKFLLFNSSIRAQPAWSRTNEGREKFIHEFFDNSVYFIFRKVLLQENLSSVSSKSELQQVCLFASILSWFAKIDGYISREELSFMHNALVTKCNLSADIASCIVRVANSIDVSEFQLSSLCSSYRESSVKKEQEKVFKSISKLIILDQKLTASEFESLRTLGLYLQIPKQLWCHTVERIKQDVDIFEE